VELGFLLECCGAPHVIPVGSTAGSGRQVPPVAAWTPSLDPPAGCAVGRSRHESDPDTCTSPSGWSSGRGETSSTHDR